MELKPYQQQVINDLSLFLENIQETKDVKVAFNNFLVITDIKKLLDYIKMIT